MPNPRLYPAQSGTHNEYEVIANAQIIGRITRLPGRSKPWFWALGLPFRGSRRHPGHGFEATSEAAMEVFDKNWHANRRELPLPHPAQDQPQGQKRSSRSPETADRELIATRRTSL